MHYAMQYGPIQGQRHEPFKVGNLAIFKSCLLHQLKWKLATDHSLIPKLGHNIRIFDVWPSFVSRDFEVGSNVSCEESTISPIWANLFC